MSYWFAGFELHGTMLKVDIGDILEQKGDAVVASVGKGFDMHGIMLSFIRQF